MLNGQLHGAMRIACLNSHSNEIETLDLRLLSPNSEQPC